MNTLPHRHEELLREHQLLINRHEKLLADHEYLINEAYYRIVPAEADVADLMSVVRQLAVHTGFELHDNIMLAAQDGIK